MNLQKLLLLSLLTLSTSALFALSASPATACGNSMRVEYKNPTARVAAEYFEEAAYRQALDTAFSAHKSLAKLSKSYTEYKSKNLKRAALIAAASITRLQSAPSNLSKLLAEEDLLAMKKEHLAWAEDVLVWAVDHYKQRPDTVAFLAEFRARSEDEAVRAASLKTLQELADADLLPDAYSYATLAALQRQAKQDDSSAVKTCQTRDANIAHLCGSVSLVPFVYPEVASYSVEDKLEIKSHSRTRSKKSRSKSKSKSASITLD